LANQHTEGFIIWWTTKKVKFTLLPCTEKEVQPYSFFTSMLDEGAWLTPHPSHFTTGNDLVPLYRLAGWPQGWSGCVWKILPHVDLMPRLRSP